MTNKNMPVNRITSYPAKNKKPVRIAVYLARFIVFLIMCLMIFSLTAAVFFIGLNARPATGVTEEPVSEAPVQESEEPCISIDLSEAAEAQVDTYAYEFLADLSEFEEYMNPADRDGYLQLINYENRLDASYKPDDLIEIPTRSDRETQRMRKTPAMALKALLKEAEANGIGDITVTSGWRSYNTQQWLLDAQVSKYKADMNEDEAYALAITEVAVPGTSEHQSGLCVDMHNLPSADVSFAESASANWLAENCYKFGFILRYPKDKTEITKISFEPWHFRFVGRYHASRIYELGMCLEEYIDFLSGGQ